MGFKNIIGVVLMVLAMHVATAQQMPDKKNPKTKINQKDSKGRKQGTWVNNMPQLKGEPAYSEFGSYHDGLKSGLWYKMNIGGDLFAIENYTKDVLDGEVKYFTKGQITCIGLYRGLNPDVEVDTIVVVEPVTGEQILVAVQADRGTVRHGTWRFFDEMTGRMTKIEEYQIDSMIYEEYFVMSKADSLYYEKRNKNLPHLKKTSTSKPAKKQHSYLN